LKVQPFNRYILRIHPANPLQIVIKSLSKYPCFLLTYGRQPHIFILSSQTKGNKMEIICHDCGTVFDVFLEGMSNQYVTACGECWSIELERREIGGVFTR
jgi:hypothetical protein